MKPKDLKSPYGWTDRRPVIEGSVFFVPDYYPNYEEFTFPGWTSVFGREAPLNIEYCSGNGSWVIDKAENFPDINWVAIEWRFDRVRKIWSKSQNLGLKNLFIVNGEGLTTTRHYFPASSVNEVFVNFPDPWPKERHSKHRIVSPTFTSEIQRILVPDGTITLVTDDLHTSQRMIETLSGQEGLQAVYPEPHYRTDLPGYGSSFFEELWRSRGCEIRYHQFMKGSHVASIA